RDAPPGRVDRHRASDDAAASGNDEACVMTSFVDDPRVRRALNFVVAGLLGYWVIDRLWPAPLGIMLKGAALGGLYALIALGIAPVYRANSIINFAQGDIGAVPASLAL